VGTALRIALVASAMAPLYAADISGVSADDESNAKEFSSAIDRLNALDPQSPETLNIRLDYADFLAKAQGGDCHVRLENAQAQLDSARASPALGIELPSGLARAADVEYQIHFARASCGASAEIREQELRAASETAQRSVDLYREAFDAVSMATMQFNAGVAYHSAGHNDAAIAALQAAIAMDREYGYEEDAKDNYRLLLQWTHEDSGPDQVAAMMQDFPQRFAKLTFGWFESDWDSSVETDYAQVSNGEILQVRRVRPATRRVRKGLMSWVVSYQPSEGHDEFGKLPNEELSAAGLTYALARMVLQFHDFDVARDGEFDGTEAGFRFDSRVHADLKTLTRELEPNGNRATRLTRDLRKTVEALLSQGTSDALTAEDYNWGTGTWIGATLDQGVWYNMVAQLSLPLEPRFFIAHKIEFTYTRDLPCTSGSTDSCIEIVLHATPDPEVLKAMLKEHASSARLPRGQAPQLWSVIHMRLIVDPATLVPYRREMRRHSYWSTGAAGPNHTLIESEKTVFVNGAARTAR
jgi:tetratricopeptide (TPR) repeat protein